MSKKMIETIPATVKVHELPEAIGSVLLFVADHRITGPHVYGALVRTGMVGWIATNHDGYLNNNDVRGLIESGKNVGDMGGEGYWIEPDEQEATYIS